jgi:glycosyltransferase involved in cell wall biosynthesis
MTLSIIIPVKNEEEIILNTLSKLDNSWLFKIEHEIIIINDHSTDQTKKLIESFKSKKINIIIKDNNKKGLGSAIITGIE